jgi:hypothetical protein
VRRSIILWAAVGALVIAGFVSTVLILNASLYSSAGFVRGYLDALARHDAEGALELAGPSVAGDASTALLQRDALGELSGIRLVGDTETSPGEHTVVYAYEAGGVTGQSTFEVRQTGTLLWLFPTWTFDTSPLAVIDLTVEHADSFTANGVDLVTPRQNEAVPYLIFTPGLYEFTHESALLTAEPVRLAATEPDSTVPATLDIQASDEFATRVSAEVNSFLDDCATQEVLMPTGCPFGQTMTNRIDSSPAWSIVAYPDVTVIPGNEPSQWRMSQTAAKAHLLVDVKSLFDGSVSTFDEDVPFTVRATIVLQDQDQLAITVQ